MATLLEEEIIYTDTDATIIETFKSTYNARYLRDFEGENELKNRKIMKLLNDLIQGGKNPVLVKLIQNLSLPKTYNEQFIEGPYFLAKMKQNETRKTAYIFGEAHIGEDLINGSCLPNPSIQFQEYIFRLATNSPAFIDFYIEHHMVKSDYVYSNDYIISVACGRLINSRPGTYTDIFKLFNSIKEEIISLQKNNPLEETSSYIMDETLKKFFNCFSPLKRNDELCKIIRVHSIDMRQGIVDENIKTVISIDIISVLSIVYTMLEKYIDKKINSPTVISYHLKTIRNSFINDKRDSLLDLLVSQMKEVKEGKGIRLLFHTKKIQKEYRNSYEKNRIARFINYKIRNIKFIREAGNQLDILLNSENTVIETTFLEEIKKLKLVIEDMHLLCMDYYALLRIFKEYKPREKPNVLDHPLKSTNIIIYAGQEHSANYYTFFHSIGFENIVRYRNPKATRKKLDNKGYCVDMKNSTHN
jgi:hypothetical protein